MPHTICDNAPKPTTSRRRIRVTAALAVAWLIALLLAPGTAHALPSNGWVDARATTSLAQSDQDDELDFANLSYPDGAAGIALIGPTLVAKGIDQQVLIADVTNHSAADSRYAITLSSDDLDGSVSVSVPARKTGRVEIPITVANVSDGARPVTAELRYDGTVMSSSTLDVIAVDLSEPETREEVTQTLEEVVADPPAGLDQGVVDALDAGVAEEVGVDLADVEAEVPADTPAETPVDIEAAADPAEATTTGSSLPLPLWALGAIGGVVILVVGIVIGRVGARRS